MVTIKVKSTREEDRQDADCNGSPQCFYDLLVLEAHIVLLSEVVQVHMSAGIGPARDRRSLR